MLTVEDQKYILSEFPDIKLSYENITHKKVYNSELVIAIPEGVKCFAWFTYFKESPVCLLIELGPDKKPCLYIRPVYSCFKTDLAYGTILYGTMISNNQFFAIEDIFHYKGADVSRKNWGDKMCLFHSLLSNDLQQIAYNKGFVVFGLPPFAKTFEDIVCQIKSIRGYRFASIQFRLLGRCNNYLYMQWHSKSTLSTFEKSGAKSEATISTFEKSGAKSEATRSESVQSTFRKGGFLSPSLDNFGSTFPKGGNLDNFGSTFPKGGFGSTFPKGGKVERIKEAIFTVKPDLQNDIYHLYEEGDKYISIALIPDFKTSVMMNKLFRNIKENTNLDALEESDDEDEFEDDRDDRFVFMDKSYKMVCVYNHKFKKWAPVRLFLQK
jgi:hypothetical protein